MFCFSVECGGFSRFQESYFDTAELAPVINQSCRHTVYIVGVNFALFVLFACSVCSRIPRWNVEQWAVVALQYLHLVHYYNIKQCISSFCPAHRVGVVYYLLHWEPFNHLCVYFIGSASISAMMSYFCITVLVRPVIGSRIAGANCQWVYWDGIGNSILIDYDGTRSCIHYLNGSSVIYNSSLAVCPPDMPMQSFCAGGLLTVMCCPGCDCSVRRTVLSKLPLQGAGAVARFASIRLHRASQRWRNRQWKVLWMGCLCHTIWYSAGRVCCSWVWWRRDSSRLNGIVVIDPWTCIL